MKDGLWILFVIVVGIIIYQMFSGAVEINVNINHHYDSITNAASIAFAK